MELVEAGWKKALELAAATLPEPVEGNEEDEDAAVTLAAQQTVNAAFAEKLLEVLAVLNGKSSAFSADYY